MQNKIKTHLTQIIKNPKGDIYKFINKKNKFFRGFGEIYFTQIKYNKVKGWKLHKKMDMTLIVPHGKVKFVLINNNDKSLKEIIIGSEKKNYKVLTIPSNIWFGFKGYYKPFSIICNLSNIVHNPSETKSCKLTEISYDW